MRIGELAKVTGCTPRALRHYEEQGLIAATRAANGYREYDDATVTRVRNIRHLLGAGLTLDDVRVFLPCLDGDVAAAPPSPAGLRVGRERLAVLDARIAAQLAVRDRLAAALRDAAATPATDDDPRPGTGRTLISS
ncbi:MerR family transcriptional regulator [Micromonospora halotolerans]|uniref:MerR family transcriptional regulator n=1 Tax=Micromonospora halotolerans TaxID=709879 RepID=A0ABY9ZRS3_9ACTN|nr:MerR family transcriptional regulator [Micromonospora halotolerans]WNM37705.1 MerR family transcriptional regulator [Micromonospora halotolerans]